MMRLARLAELSRRLRAVLHERPELALAFSQAFERHDEQALGRAFEGLQRETPAVRRDAEAAILEWLFGSGSDVDPANMVREPTPTRH